MTENKKKNTTVMVFGTFDGVHDGHRYFLKEAKKFGDRLVVAVAKDTTVKTLKGHLPATPLPNRIMNLKHENLADEVVQGDQEIGKWQIVKTINPDTICLGYDQENLRNALLQALEDKKLSFKIETIKPFKGDIFHSSILNKKEMKSKF